MYKTGHAFNYLLLKEIVANNLSRLAKILHTQRFSMEYLLQYVNGIDTLYSAICNLYDW